MTKDDFKVEFKRLCEGFSYQPRPTQMDAFYDRLQHCHPADWTEAVTDLLCAPKFPFNLEVILETIERRAEHRRRMSVHREHQEAVTQTRRLTNSVSMREALAEKPELLASLERLLKS